MNTILAILIGAAAWAAIMLAILAVLRGLKQHDRAPEDAIDDIKRATEPAMLSTWSSVQEVPHEDSIRKVLRPRVPAGSAYGEPQP